MTQIRFLLICCLSCQNHRLICLFCLRGVFSEQVGLTHTAPQVLNHFPGTHWANIQHAVTFPVFPCCQIQADCDLTSCSCKTNAPSNLHSTIPLTVKPANVHTEILPHSPDTQKNTSMLPHTHTFTHTRTHTLLLPPCSIPPSGYLFIPSQTFHLLF